MTVIFAEQAHEEFEAWRKSSPKAAEKIIRLIEDIAENGPNKGIGKPEKLKHYKNPVRFSREINKGNRMVYSIKDHTLVILSCKGHYDDH